MASPSLGRQPASAPRTQVSRAKPAVAGALSFAFFLWLTLAVYGARTQSFDLHWRSTVHAWSTPQATEFMLYATQSGAIVALTLLSMGVILGFLFLKLKRAAALMAANMVGAWVLNDSLKILFHRPRPEPFFGLLPPGDYSFPSGHSLCSFCFYAMIAALFWTRIRSRTARVGVVAVTGVVIVTVGLSRVYLGVHYPTDVLGAWAIGLCWVSFLMVFDEREEAKAPAATKPEPFAPEAPVADPSIVDAS
jgi:undecaprenyl-diphosphatase